MRLRLLVLAGGALLLALAAHAQAQQTEPELTLSTDGLAAPLMPDGQTQTITVHWSYTPAPTNQATDPQSSEYVLAWTPRPSCADSGVIITGPATTRVPKGTAPQPTYTGTQEWTVTATADAPGETPITCAFNGIVSGATQLAAEATASLATDVNVATTLRLAVQLPVTIQEGGPGKVLQYDVEVTNLGNVRANVDLDVGDLPEGWTVELPKQVLLESAAQGGTAVSQTVRVLVTTPDNGGWNNAETALELRATASSTNDPAQQVSTSHPVLARVRGWSWSWPAPLYPVVPVVLAAAAVVVAQRLRRRKGSAASVPAQPARTSLLRPGPARKGTRKGA